MIYEVVNLVPLRRLKEETLIASETYSHLFCLCAPMPLVIQFEGDIKVFFSIYYLHLNVCAQYLCANICYIMIINCEIVERKLIKSI